MKAITSVIGRYLPEDDFRRGHDRPDPTSNGVWRPRRGNHEADAVTSRDR